MAIIKCILHPTDFSNNSLKSLYYAISIAEKFDAELHLLYVVADALFILSPPVSGLLPEGYRSEVIESADHKLSRMPDSTLASNLKIVRKVVEGNAIMEIIRYAEENNNDMIIMGTHGYTGLLHLLMGSVAENVVRKASCPVLTVRPDTPENAIS